jgi:hypothetical protein
MSFTTRSAANAGTWMPDMQLDTNALQGALTPTTSVLNLDKPLYHYENQTKKARVLKQMLDADISLIFRSGSSSALYPVHVTKRMGAQDKVTDN